MGTLRGDTGSFETQLGASMWVVNIRDLQWRSRRFAIGVAATSVLFGVTLMFQGLPRSLDAETAATLDDVGADLWFTADTVTGPFTGASVLPVERVDDVRALDGIDAAAPLIVLRESVRAGSVETVIMIGHEVGGLGTPTLAEGRAVEARGEAVVDRSMDLGLDVGEVLTIGSVDLEVVGETDGRSFTGGVPVVYLGLEDAQAVATQGLELSNVIVAEGTTTATAEGLQAFSPAEVGDDLLRPAGRIVEALDRVKFLLWFSAAGVVGSLVYLTTRERTVDLAVMKALGVPDRSILTGTLFQALALTTAAMVGGTIGGLVLAPTFPLPITVPVSAVVVTGAIALGITVVVSVVTARIVLAIDPALAFGRN